MLSKMKHIDDAQPATVDEHFNILLADTKSVITESFEDVTSSNLPDWFDEELFKAGQKYYLRNILGMSASAVAGLIAVLSIPSILEILIYTKQSGSPCTAFKRYLETMHHIRAWYMTDIDDKNSDWWKTTNVVRWKHCNVSRRSHHDGPGGITHRDMALTQFGFVGYVLLESEKLGLRNSPEEREGFNHVWRVLGHLLGISDRLNICRKTAAETAELCQRLRKEVFSKYMMELPPNFIEMTEAMLDGLWTVDMAINKDGFFAFTYQLTGIPYHKPLSLLSSIDLFYRQSLHKICGVPIIGTVVRVYYNHFLNFNLWLSKRWPIVAWIRFGKKQSTLNLYPKLK